ncbi:MAG: grasp-with-spasm system ATP-grasp peptide maturase [Acidobacteria bacterium]|nr:grasp-with-spasm system ATP-grasp peptide maturase [Acidobacteriota bacterium]
MTPLAAPFLSIAEAAMILVLSQSSHELTTEEVMDWLEDLGLPCLRLNGEDLDADSSWSARVPGGDFEITLDGRTLKLAAGDIQAVWFRRWAHGRRDQPVELILDDSRERQEAQREISSHLDQEMARLSGYLFSQLHDAAWLSRPSITRLNKLEVLEEAARAGLEVPATLITTRKKHLEEFMRTHGGIITKSIGESRALHLGDYFHTMLTAEIGTDLIAQLPEDLFPSLFQEKLDKRYEIRAFYLAGELYSMAIFSQIDDQTRVDFRHYNNVKPNRVVPFKLPADIADRISRLMGALELETGSLDLVKTTDGRYVFLEVNPVGQFGMVSKPCNYHLEQRVAEILARKARHGNSPQPV